MARRSPARAKGKLSWPKIDEIHTLIFDFDGVFTDNRVIVSQDGMEMVSCSRADGLGMDMLRRHIAQNGSPTAFILSTEANLVVTARARKLKMECLQGVADKLQSIENHFAQTLPNERAPFDGLMYVGNDLNDLAVMRRATYSVAPADAHPLVRRAATFTLPQFGGRGFVRAIVERLLQLNTLSTEEVCELVSDR
jgi:3-deoxy-D-manno-octulosonate 8-phosphate phosphatase (KDO 8-P phosphatase)